MCGGDTCFGPGQLRFKVTRWDTLEEKTVWALTPEGAIKVANWPPSRCNVQYIAFVTTWVEPDEPGDRG